MAYNSTSWTTDANTKAGSTGTNTVGGVTLYKEFGLWDFSPSVGAHNTLSSMNTVYTASSAGLSGASSGDAFGTGTDPALAIDIDAEPGNRSHVINGMWYIEDNINIDSVRVIATADGNQSLNFHLYSFAMDKTTNYGDLASGTLLAHIGASMSASDSTIKTDTLIIDSSTVNAGRIVLAFAEAETDTTDFTCQMIVKYHLI